MTESSGAHPRVLRKPVGERLPDFPWDSLADATALAKLPPGRNGRSFGRAPIDPVAPHIQLALRNPPRFRATRRQRERCACAKPLLGQCTVATVSGLSAESGVLPVVGTKEAIAWLPTPRSGEGHTVVIPELAYPTYEVSARLAGAEALRSDSLLKLYQRRSR